MYMRNKRQRHSRDPWERQKNAMVLSDSHVTSGTKKKKHERRMRNSNINNINERKEEEEKKHVITLIMKNRWQKRKFRCVLCAYSISMET